VAYPVTPENLNLAVRNNDAVEPVTSANNEYENISCCSEIWAEGHHEETKENLQLSEECH
jgi:hypothetical protein